jgi:hypothetical protein
MSLLLGPLKKLWIGLVLLAGLAPVGLAREVIVTTHAGQELVGELLSETPETVIIVIAQIKTPIARADIAKLEYKKSIEEVFAQRRGALADDDVEGRYNLVYFLFAEEAFALAQQEVNLLAQAFPDNQDIQRLAMVIESKILLEAQREQAPPPKIKPRTPRGEKDEPKQHVPSDLLTNEQVNLIRIWELPSDLAEAKPLINISRKTIDKLFEQYTASDEVPKGRQNQNRFRALKGYEQLELFFTLRARSLYPEIIVKKDPPSLAEFRRFINPAYVARYFHRHFGSGKFEQFKLFHRNPNNINEAYTNFYILSTTAINGMPLIDRAEPRRSLLVQWGMRRADAHYPAPDDIPNWRPFFKNQEDKRLLQYIEWIESLLYMPTPKYGIVYPPPVEEESQDKDVPKTPPAKDSNKKTNAA